MFVQLFLYPFNNNYNLPEPKNHFVVIQKYLKLTIL